VSAAAPGHRGRARRKTRTVATDAQANSQSRSKSRKWEGSAPSTVRRAARTFRIQPPRARTRPPAPRPRREGRPTLSRRDRGRPAVVGGHARLRSRLPLRDDGAASELAIKPHSNSDMRSKRVRRRRAVGFKDGTTRVVTPSLRISTVGSAPQIGHSHLRQQHAVARPDRGLVGAKSVGERKRSDRGVALFQPSRAPWRLAGAMPSGSSVTPREARRRNCYGKPARTAALAVTIACMNRRQEMVHLLGRRERQVRSRLCRPRVPATPSMGVRIC